MVVAYFLIGRNEGSLSFIHLTFQAFLAFYAEYLGAVSRNGERNGIAVVGVWSLKETVVVLHRSAHFDGCRVEANGLFAVARVVDGERTFFALQLLYVLYHDVALALLFGHIGLQMEWILIECDEVVVAHQLQRLGAYVACVATDEQRRRHDAPHAEVCLVFHLCQRAPHFEHIHVVVVSVVAICAEVEVLGQDVAYTSPRRVDVACGSPAVGHIGSPRARVSPPTHIIYYVFLAAVFDGIRYLGVLLAFVESHVVAATVIDFDEVEVPVDEVQVAVLVFMPSKTYTDAPCMTVSAAAGVVACIGIDTGLQS